MGEFPSGQRGQTVNLLSTTSVVRIHLLPPKILVTCVTGIFTFFTLHFSLEYSGFWKVISNSE